jgi:hypothetical protein
MFVASKNTARIALEEVKAGLVRFEDLPPIDLKKKKTGKEKLSEKEKAWKISKK